MTSSIASRAADVGDYDAFARLFPELGVPDPVPDLAKFNAMILPELRVATETDRVVGIVWSRQRGEKLHVVYVIVDAAWRRHGVGRALMSAAASHARALGLSQWMLNVKPDNVGARALYEQCGMREVMASASVKIAWKDIAGLPESPSCVVTPLVDDARYEAAIESLGNGEIAAMKALPGRVFFGADFDGAPVGIVGFDAAFPGASPFRVIDPRFARALLEVVRPLARAEHDHLYAFAEGDPALEAELVAAGGTVALRTLRMEGPVPQGAGPTMGGGG